MSECSEIATDQVFSLECPECGYPAFGRLRPVWAEDEEDICRCGSRLRLGIYDDGDAESPTACALVITYPDGSAAE